MAATTNEGEMFARVRAFRKSLEAMRERMKARRVEEAPDMWAAYWHAQATALTEVLDEFDYAFPECSDSAPTSHHDDAGLKESE